MNFAFAFLIRLIVFVGLGSVVLAVGVSKLAPPKPILRFRVATRFSNISEYFMNYAGRIPRWLDAESGKVIISPLDASEVLEVASCSPWVDEKGRHQVVGRWATRTTMGPTSVSTDFGLARYTFPDGQLLDHVSTEIIPVGPPCWFPGTRAKVLFTAGDGLLYYHAFEADPVLKQNDPEAKADASPTPVIWSCSRPGLGQVFLSDLTWPEDPRLNGLVVVALRAQFPETETSRTFSRTGLWWLKLNHSGTEIVESGRLLWTEDRPEGESRIDRRSPTVGKLPDGRLGIAYLAADSEAQGWELRVAPIEFEGDHRIPIALESSSVKLAGGCQPAHPSFSADGRWINAIAETTEPNGRIIRLPLAGAFPVRK